MLWRYILLVILLFKTLVIAQSPQDSVNNRGNKIFFYPYLFYTPETKLAFGAAALSSFRTSMDKNNKVSKISLSGYYSIRKMYNITLAPELYLKGETFFISSDINFGTIIDKFWGIGNKTENVEDEDYTHRTFSMYLNFQTQTIGHLKMGGIWEFKNVYIVDKKENAFLQSDEILGNNGGFTSGLGLAFSVDSRNNIFYPSNGGFYEFSAVFFGEKIGGKFNFNRFLLNLRSYFSVVERHILAFQAYGNMVTGSPPFYEYPALGGQNTLRGYFKGRYRDKIYLMTQVEYRTIVWWRIGVVGFFGIGDVGETLSQFALKDLKYSMGFGLRFVIDVMQELNVRMDFGFGRDSSGLYFAIEEAF